LLTPFSCQRSFLSHFTHGSLGAFSLYDQSTWVFVQLYPESHPKFSPIPLWFCVCVTDDCSTRDFNSYKLELDVTPGPGAYNTHEFSSIGQQALSSCVLGVPFTGVAYSWVCNVAFPVFPAEKRHLLRIHSVNPHVCGHPLRERTCSQATAPNVPNQHRLQLVRTLSAAQMFVLVVSCGYLSFGVADTLITAANCVNCHQAGLLELPSVGKQAVSTRRTQPAFTVR
jgi:hypothetical protein